MTDKQSSSDIDKASQMSRDNGVDVFTIGLGKHYNLTELMALSTRTDYFINGRNYTTDFCNTASIIGDKICQLDELGL